jgi:hypothetical protein
LAAAFFGIGRSEYPLVPFENLLVPFALLGWLPNIAPDNFLLTIGRRYKRRTLLAPVTSPQANPWPRLSRGSFLLPLLTVPVEGGALMRSVEEYKQFENDCRKLAAKLEKADDRLALELMAAAWARLAVERKRQLENETRQQL